MSEDESRIYGMITRWPGDSITLGSVDVTSGMNIRMLGSNQTLSWSKNDDAVVVNLPRPDQVNSKWVWTLAFSK